MSLEGTLLTLDAATGRELWHSDLRAAGPASPPTNTSAPLIDNGILYATKFGVFALDPATGDELWSFFDESWDAFTAEGPELGTPALADGVLVVPAYGVACNASAFCDDGTGHVIIYALDSVTGTRRWATDLEVEWGTELDTIVISNGLVFFDNVWQRNGSGGGSESVVALELRSGAIVWQREFRDGVTLGEPAAANGALYVPTEQWDGTTSRRRIHALEATTGQVLWSASAAGRGPSVVGDVLVFTETGDESSELVLLGARRRAVMARQPLEGDTFHIAPVIADGVAFVGTGAGMVYAVRLPGAEDTGHGGGGAGGAGGTAGAGGAGGAGRRCIDKYDCDVGEICDASGLCGAEPSACGIPDDCGNGHVCINGACVTGCESNADCAHDPAASRCNLGAGSCEPCRLSIDCPPGLTCNGGTCTDAPGCGSADACPGGQGCHAGTCGACTSDNECRAGESCVVGTGTCQLDTSCTDAECQQRGRTWFCDAVTGECFSGCTGDADCFGGQTCNVGTHQCGGGGGNCTQTGCPAGESCNVGTGACEAQSCCAGLACPVGEGCQYDGGGGCSCVVDACCTNAICEANGQSCVIDSPGVCHCLGGGTGCVDQNAADACTQNCLQTGQSCDLTTCTCGGGGCGSANCDACCMGACTQTPGLCDDPNLLFLCLTTGACL